MKLFREKLARLWDVPVVAKVLTSSNSTKTRASSSWRGENVNLREERFQIKFLHEDFDLQRVDRELLLDLVEPQAGLGDGALVAEIDEQAALVRPQGATEERRHPHRLFRVICCRCNDLHGYLM